MQLAILLHLMKRRAVLPSKRTVLYDKYIEIFMDRESKDATIAANRDHIIAFHRLLGWVIHTEVEAGRSSGSVTLPELHRLLTSYMNARGHDGNLVNQLFSSVTTRVLCLVQQNFDSAHEFRFEVQSLREYFASEHIYAMSPNNTPKNSHAAALAHLALRPFWANVMRFLAGKFSFGEIAGIIYALRDLQRNPQVGKHPIVQAAAATLLEDQVLSDQEQSVTVDMVHIMLDGPGTTFAVDGLLNQTEPPVLTDPRQQGLVLSVLLDQLKSTTTPEAMGVLTRYGRTVTTSRVLIDRWWEMYTDTDVWLRCAIELGVLTAHTAPAQHEMVDQIVTRYPATVYLRRLIANSAQVVTSQLFQSAAAELCAGFDDNLSPDVDDSPYRRLVEAASVEHFFRHRYRPGPGDALEPVKRSSPNSSRTRRRSQARNAMTEMIDKLNVAHQGRVSTSSEWHELFDLYSAIWGVDCWPTREAAFVLPTDAVDTESQPSIAVGASWRAISAWLRQASAHPDDTQWWRVNVPETPRTELESMTLVLAAISSGRHTLIAAMSDQLENHLTMLGDNAFGALVRAAERDKRYSPFKRELRFDESLRLRSFQPSPRMAAVLWHQSSKETKKRLARIILDASIPWTSAPTATQIFTTCLAMGDSKTNVPSLEGARFALPSTSLASEQIRKPTYPDAVRVLADPASWPTDVVWRSANHLTTRLERLRPVSEVAAADGWNCDPSS